MLLPANVCVIILRCGRPVSRPFTKIIAKDYMDDIDYILWFTSMIWTLYHNICRMRRSGSSSNPPSPTRKTRHPHGWRVFLCLGICEGGFERRLLATVRWTVATAVAFPQKSESTFPHQKDEAPCGDSSFCVWGILLFSLFTLLFILRRDFFR